ncbi:MAG: hypothetical protein ACOYX1_17035 [Acidobacteriota bacterium]
MRASEIVAILLWSACALAQPPAEDAALSALLEKSAAHGRLFAAEFPAYTCNERVLQVKYGQGNHVDAKQEEMYDYLILIHGEAGGLTFEESRIRRQGPEKPPQRPLLATTGFAVLSVIFHEEFQSSYQFRRLGPEALGGRMTEKVAFEAVPGRPSPSVLEVGGRQYSLEWRGTAWLDPASGAVVRIEAALAGTLDDIGLVGLRAEVDYAAVEGAQALWLPRQAIVEARTLRQRWRNVHAFSGFRRFEVQTEQKIGEVRQ